MSASSQLEHVWLGDLPVVAVNGSGGLYPVLSDHLGTPRQIIDTNKQVRWLWDNLDPFGNNTPNPNPAGLGNFTYNLRFAGQFFDSESGLNYNYYRNYDPKTGRYTQSDPIGLGGRLNTFGYVGGNPVRWVDPTGLMFVVDDVAEASAFCLVNPACRAALGAGAKMCLRYGARIWAAYNSSSDDSQQCDDECPVDNYEKAKEKIPSEWGAGNPNRKGKGTRWQDPNNPGNGVRYDEGNPNNSQSTQQEDHVVVRKDGQVIGRDGNPIPGSIKGNPDQAHIPASEYSNWPNWYSPK